MDFLSKLNLISIPFWVKAAIILVLAFLGVVNTYLFFEGLLISGNKDMVKASVELLSVVLPIFILALLVAKADTGTHALALRTADILSGVVPEALARLMESPAAFYAPTRKRRARPRGRRAQVAVNLADGECYSDYRIDATGPDGAPCRVHVRIELNVRKVNFNLYVPVNKLAAAAGAAPGLAGISATLMARFRHTIEGAGMGGVVMGADSAAAEAGYTFNTVAVERRLDGVDYACLVAKKDLPRDFLWNSSEQLFFANDLKLMVRSFLHEAPEYFRLA